MARRRVAVAVLGGVVAALVAVPAAGAPAAPTVAGSSAVVPAAAGLVVYTPRGTAVHLRAVPENTIGDLGPFLMEREQPYIDRGAVRLAGPTNQYNCHSYAWYLQSARNTYSMDDPRAFWNDGSYVRVASTSTTAAIPSSVPNGARGVWMDSTGKAVHSAVVSYPLTGETRRVFISKWDNGSLMRHAPGNSKYDEGTSRIDYYVRNTNPPPAPPAPPGGTPVPPPPPPPPADGSLLGNGSVEVGSVAYWNRIAPANIVIVGDAARAHSGAGFLATNAPTAGSGSVFTDATTSVAVGQVLRGRVWMRAETGTSAGLLCLWGLGMSANENTCTDYAVGTSWSPVEVTLGVRGAHSSARLEVYPDVGAPTVWLDDASLTKETLLSNGSLEMGSVEYWNRIAPANIVIVNDPAKAHSGSRFLATNTTSTGSVYTDATTSVAVGQVLRGRAWLRADAGTSKGTLCLWGLGASANENECTRYSVGTTWTPVDVALGARGAHSTARLEVYPDTGAPTVLVDDLTLTKDSLLGNGSLEVGSVAHWNRTAPANIVVYSNPANAHSGAGFLATNTTSTGSVYSDAATTVSIGQVLQGRAWLRAGSGTATGRLCLWGLGVSANEKACTRYSIGTTWTPVDVALGARGAHSTVRLEVYPDANAPTVWIDDVSLTR